MERAGIQMSEQGGGLCLVHESVHSLVIIDLESEGVLREGSPDETSAPGEIPAFSSLRLGKERGDVFASSEVSERFWFIAIRSCFPTSLQVTFCTAENSSGWCWAGI